MGRPRQRPSAWLTTLAAAIATAWSIGAHAQQAQSSPGASAVRSKHSTSIEIPNGCGTAEELHHKLRTRLGRELSAHSLRASITRSTTGFHLRVQVDQEVRELDDPHCRPLFDAAAVVAVAMLLRERAGSQAARSEPAPTPSSPSPRPLHWRAALNAGIAAGILPRPTASLGAGAQGWQERWGASVRVTYLLPQETRDLTGRGVVVRGYSVNAGALFWVTPAWQARTGVAAERLVGRGVGARAVQSAGTWALGPHIGMAYVPLRSSSVWLGIDADAQWHAVRGRFKILNYSENIYEAPVFSGEASVSFGLIW